MPAQPDNSLARQSIVDIAVLDDDTDFLSYIEDFLADEGRYRCRVFTRPADLLASIEERKPEIVLLDMKMGPHRGEDVLEELQGRAPGVCVIIVTGYPSLEDMRTTFQRKVFDYIAKPFSLDSMRETLGRAVAVHGFGRSDHDRLRERLGQRVKVLRVEKKWSLKELAQMTGVSISQLSSIERGTHLPSLESLLSLCRGLNTRPSELLDSIDF